MGKINRFIDYYSSENRFAIYLSVFRIFIGFHIIKKVYLLWGSQSILFGSESFLVNSSKSIGLFEVDAAWFHQNHTLVLYGIVLTAMCFMFGIGKYFTAILLYLQMKFFQDITHLTMNGGDNLLIFILLYYCFADCYQYFSYHDSKKQSGRFAEVRNFVTNAAAFSIMIHLCWVYFITAMHKIHADVWFNGVATYYILNLERYQGPFNHLISNNGFIVTVSTYFTVLFELLFPILIWQSAFRYLLMIAGIGLHLGIYFFMMIYDFEILFIMIYGFYIPNRVWENVLAKVKSLSIVNKVQMAFFKKEGVTSTD